MIEIGTIAFMGVLGGAFLWAAVRSTRAPWKRAAPELGLEFQSNFFLASPRLAGRLRGFDVDVFLRGNGVRLEVHGVHPGFTLRRESATTWAIRSELEIGDQEFDHRFRIVGDEDLVLALLGHETRYALRRLMRYDEDGVSDGKLHKLTFDLKKARATLDSMLDLAEALRRPEPEDVPKLLSKRALEDTAPGVRRRAFHLLATSSVLGDEARDTARQLRDVADVALRLEARRVLLREPAPEGAEAARGLMQMARQVPSQSLSIRAIQSVASSAFRKEHVSDMAYMLHRSSGNFPHVRRAALAGLVRARALDELLQVELGDDPDVTVEMARGLRRIGTASEESAESAQTRLFELLEHPKAQVRVEAAKALGAVGDLRAVVKLRQALDSGVLAKLALGRAAESAIEQIQTRIGGSQAGEISLVEPEPLEGAVSPADEDKGDDESDGPNTNTGGGVSLA